MDILIYHNPACGTSRKVLAMIEAAGFTPTVVEYLKTPPTRPELMEIVAQLPGGVRALLREKAPPFEDLGLADLSLSESELIDAILAHPILMNRPLVRAPKSTRLCRPAETVLDLLS